MASCKEKEHLIFFKKQQYVKNNNIPVKTGKFGAMMDVELINDGPVTFMLEF